MTGYNNLDERGYSWHWMLLFPRKFFSENQITTNIHEKQRFRLFSSGAPNPLNFFTTFIIALFLMILVVFFVDIQADSLKNIPCSHFKKLN